MLYKVFLVEDEIVTREGIRDNVNWEASGFQFCGDAPDGEMALSRLEALHPDVLITDIKMPFMDGLQLSKIVRERLPRVKIVILSGHDEFEYAQAAIKLGVAEYLLKPVSVEDLHSVLRRVAAQIEREQQEQADLRDLQSQVATSRAALRESLFLQLVLDAIPPAEALEQGQALGIELVAHCYLVALVRVDHVDAPVQTGHIQDQFLQQVVASVVGDNPDLFLLKKERAEIVLILKGQQPASLQETGRRLLASIRQRAQESNRQLAIGMGLPKLRLSELHRSFVEAVADIQGRRTENNASSNTKTAHTGLLEMDKLAVDSFLRHGVSADLDDFFATLIGPLDPATQRSQLIKNYLLMDIVVATARFVHELGGDITELVPNLGALEALLAEIQTVDEIREPARRVLLSALAFRDSRMGGASAGMIQQVKQQLAHHFNDPDLSLQDVARWINLSPNHFSMVFSHMTGTTFKGYLTELRIARAKELLRATSLRPSEIAVQVGYNDPHYFSFVFRKQTGLTPTEFRLQLPAG